MIYEVKKTQTIHRNFKKTCMPFSEDFLVKGSLNFCINIWFVTITFACTRSKTVIPFILKFLCVPIHDAHSCQMNVCGVSQGLPQSDPRSSCTPPPIPTSSVWTSSLWLPRTYFFSPVRCYPWTLLFSDNLLPMPSYVIQSIILITCLQSLLCLSTCLCHRELPNNSLLKVSSL